MSEIVGFFIILFILLFPFLHKWLTHKQKQKENKLLPPQPVPMAKKREPLASPTHLIQNQPIAPIAQDENKILRKSSLSRGKKMVIYSEIYGNPKGKEN